MCSSMVPRFCSIFGSFHSVLQGCQEFWLNDDVMSALTGKDLILTAAWNSQGRRRQADPAQGIREDQVRAAQALSWLATQPAPLWMVVLGNPSLQYGSSCSALPWQSQRSY